MADLYTRTQDVLAASTKIIDATSAGTVDDICKLTKEALEGLSPLAVLFVGLSLARSAEEPPRKDPTLDQLEAALVHGAIIQ